MLAGSRREAIGAGGAAVAGGAPVARRGAGGGASLHTDPDADRTAASIAVFPMLVLLGAAGAAAGITTVLPRRRILRDADAEDEDDPDAGGPRSRLLRIALFLLPFAVAGALILA